MILGTQLPSWKQIFQKNKKRDNKSFYEKEGGLLLSESCMSINLILRSYRDVYRRDRVILWLPDYFCNQTIYSFREEWIDIVYYPITENMDPYWDIIRQHAKETKVDIFLCVHYFGRYHASINIAREFCRLNKAILIEDCAHVLYPVGKMGQAGDFVIYSPHKQIPVRDGAVLCCNVNENSESIYIELKRLYDLLDYEDNDFCWYMKRCIQKIIPVHRKLTYYSGIHMGEDKNEFHYPKKISQQSYNTLCDYTYEKLKKMAYIRRENLCMMNYIIKSRYPDLLPIIDNTVDVPYLAVYSMRKIKDKKKIASEILDRDFTMLYWPDLPYEVKGEKGHEETLNLSRNIITFPIHQGIRPQHLIRKFADKPNRDMAEKIELNWNNLDFEEWNDIFLKFKVTNIPQEWIYGNAKTVTEGWKVKRAIIRINEIPAGTLQILERKVAGIIIAIRVNRGPLLLSEFNKPENHFEVMEILRKKYKHPVPILYAPSIEMSAENMHLISGYGWKCRDYFGFPSAIVDLSLTEEELNQNLKPNWRKNLKKARKQVHIKYNEYEANKIIQLYDGFLKKRDIPGIPIYILKYLFALKEPPLEVLTAHNEDEKMIAFKVLYVHGNTATSFIAWNTNEGLEKNARTLLIYSSMLRLKERGFSCFDLGGVDEIATEAVAKYKRGMGGSEYRLLGEFIKF